MWKIEYMFNDKGNYNPNSTTGKKCNEFIESINSLKCIEWNSSKYLDVRKKNIFLGITSNLQITAEIGKDVAMYNYNLCSIKYFTV